MLKKSGLFVFIIVTVLSSCNNQFSLLELNGSYYGPCNANLTVGGQNISSNPSLTMVNIVNNDTANFYFDTDIPLFPQHLPDVPIDIDYLSRSVRFNTTIGTDTFYGSVNKDYYLVWRYIRSDTVFHFSAQKN